MGAVGKDVEDSVVGPLAPAPRARGGGGVGHATVRRKGLDEGAHDRLLAVEAGPLRLAATGTLAELPSEREGAVVHSVKVVLRAYLLPWSLLESFLLHCTCVIKS